MAVLEFLLNEVICRIPQIEEICLTFLPDTQFPREEIMYHIRERIVCDLFKEYSRKGERESGTSEGVFKVSVNKIISRIRQRFT